MLRVIAATAAYAADQMDGADPALARSACLEAASEMVMAAAALRRCVQLRPADRKSLAPLLAGQGQPVRVIAATLGVSDRSVRNYLAAARGRAAGLPLSQFMTWISRYCRI